MQRIPTTTDRFKDKVMIVTGRVGLSAKQQRGVARPKASKSR
jgi:hypothetical protein